MFSPNKDDFTANEAVRYLENKDADSILKEINKEIIQKVNNAGDSLAVDLQKYGTPIPDKLHGEIIRRLEERNFKVEPVPNGGGYRYFVKWYKEDIE